MHILTLVPAGLGAAISPATGDNTPTRTVVLIAVVAVAIIAMLVLGFRKKPK
ncbi:MAG: LPXTG cell wall anchor domain-containing protein [Clostridia bacterium]|nr:LPXTG cell wall anchor domain-containing protein [Clostridia bacterium]